MLLLGARSIAVCSVRALSAKKAVARGRVAADLNTNGAVAKGTLLRGQGKARPLHGRGKGMARLGAQVDRQAPRWGKGPPSRWGMCPGRYESSSPLGRSSSVEPPTLQKGVQS